jgi:hypothetical protein
MDRGGPVSWTPLRGGRRDGPDEKRRQCSIEAVKRLLALLLGGLGLRALFRSRPAPVTGPDPAEELRARLAASKTSEPEPEPVPEEPGPEGVDARRADVHARARQALDDLKQ